MNTKHVKIADYINIAASAVCAVHCMLLPVLIGAVVSLNAAWITSQAFGGWMIAFTFIVGLYAIVQGTKSHKNCLPLLVFGVGLVGLIIGDIVLHNMVCEHAVKLGPRTVIVHMKGHPYHNYVTAVGGLFVMISHIANRLLCRKCCKTCN